MVLSLAQVRRRFKRETASGAFARAACDCRLGSATICFADMGNTWTHSEWGTFEYDGVDWVRPVDVPGFGAFAGKGKSKKGKFDLSFYAEHEEDRPSSAAVAV